MRALHLSVVIWLPLSLALSGQSVNEHLFDDAPAGEPPPGLAFGAFRQPDPGRWEIVSEEENGFLCHLRDPAYQQRGKPGLSLALFERAAPADLVLTARVRLPEGGRAGGLVWRYRDEEHYYSLLLDLGRQRLTLFRISGGHYIELDSANELELDAGSWHKLKIAHVDGHVRASINGVHVFDDQDTGMPWWNRSATRVGLVASGNSRVEFDEVVFGSRGAPR